VKQLYGKICPSCSAIIHPHFCWKKIDVKSRPKKTASETRKTNPLANQMNKLKIISVNLKYDDEDRGDVLARRRRSECSSFLKEINEECERREEESK